MSDMPLDGRASEDVKQPKEDVDTPRTHQKSQQPMSEKDKAEFAKKGGYNVNLFSTKPGNELEVICHMLSAINKNLATIATAMTKAKEEISDG